jgi:hypothetical protein
MPNQDYYQGYYDYFSPGGGGGTQGLYDMWGLINKYQQDPSQLTGDPLKNAQWWMGQNAGQNYANPWNFASTHYNLYPTGPHAKRYDAYLQAGGGGGKNPGAPGAPGAPAYNPNFAGNMPAGYEKYLKQWDKLMRRANLPKSIGKGFGSDVGMWQDMKGRWDQAQSQANVNIGDVARYAAALRGVEEPLYAKQTRGERLGLENRLLSQGMLGSTGGASQAEALYNAQAQAAAGRDASRYQRAEGMQQQNYQNLLAALQGGQSALTGGGAARQAQQGYHQQNFANQLASLAGAGGLFTGIHNIATQRGLGENDNLMKLLKILGVY